MRGHLLTDTAVNLLFKTIHSDEPVSGDAGKYVIMHSPDGQQVIATRTDAARAGYASTPAVPSVDPQSFSNIGHSLWAVILAIIGGGVAPETP